jgi:ubiquinone/menaquinone biosynthesis C-methylase UbiE
MSSWWLDEHAHAGAEHLDAGYVAGYDRKSGYDATEDVAVLRRYGLDDTSTVVDLGAGTGVFTVAAARVCGHVVAIDVSPAMTAVLRRKVADLGLGNVSVVEAGFLSYEHAGNPPGFVFTRNALHQLPDFWKAIALSRVAALLPPGGVLRLHDLVFDFEPADAAARIEAWFAGAVTDSAAGFTAAELATHTRDEFSTFTWLLEPMLEHAGFEILDRASRRGAYTAYTCVRR